MNVPEISIQSKNSARVEMYPVCMWFSYKTMIAFSIVGKALILHENDWGPTTGRHLNEINKTYPRYDDKSFHCLWHLYTETTTEQLEQILSQFQISQKFDRTTWLVMCDRLCEIGADEAAESIRHCSA